jgi:quinol monooxygenase YgiN
MFSIKTFETWASLGTIHDHLRSPHTKDCRENVKNIVESECAAVKEFKGGDKIAVQGEVYS